MTKLKSQGGGTNKGPTHEAVPPREGQREKGTSYRIPRKIVTREIDYSEFHREMWRWKRGKPKTAFKNKTCSLRQDTQIDTN